MTKSLYLKSISLKNFTTFEDQEIHFTHNFNAIIGETGSGKSLILDALKLITGSRSDKRYIRKDCDHTTIESIFSCDDDEVKSYFDEEGYPITDNEIIIKRIIYKDGKSKSFINFNLCPLQTLINFSRRFIDIVGQFDNQKLLSETYQLILLDDYASNGKIKKEYQVKFKELQELKEKLENLNSKQGQSSQRLDYLNFQIEELERLNPSSEDEQNLIDKKFSIVNFEKKRNATELLNSILDNTENDGLFSLINRLEKTLMQNQNYYKNIDHSPIALFKEYLVSLSSIINNDDSIVNEEEIESIIDRLDFYQRVKRKFGMETEDLKNLLTSFIREVSDIKNFTGEIKATEDAILDKQNECNALALSLENNRKKASLKFSSILTDEIRQLRMKGATVDILLRREAELNIHGFNTLEFKIETNPGEGFHKLKDIASGGELSRILLSLRKLLSSKDSISIFLFDEIDTGIGGETALLIGKSLQSVSHNSQVIAITHLPQIASFASELIKVAKEITETTNGNRTFSNIKVITGNDIKEEVMAMTPIYQN